jgi:hypothetical protein
MGMIIISLAIEDIVVWLVTKRSIFSYFLSILFVITVLCTLLGSSLAYPQFFLQKRDFIALFKAPSPNKIQGPQFAPPFSKKDQVEIVSFIEKSIPKKNRVCFYEWALVAELPPLVDRVFFPFERCHENDVLIVGPYQKGIYAINNVDVTSLIQTLCRKVVFNNAMYTVCSIKQY